MQSWIPVASIAVAFLSLLVTIIVLVRKSGIEEGAIRAKLKAACDKIRQLRIELTNRIKRTEEQQDQLENIHRNDIERVFDKIDDKFNTLDKKNETRYQELDIKGLERHKRIRKTLTINQKLVQALLMINDDIDAETINKIMASEDAS